MNILDRISICDLGFDIKMKDLKGFFKMVDKDRSGTVNAKELTDLFESGGMEVSQFMIRTILYMAGVDESGEVTFAQFVALDSKLSDENFDPEEAVRAVFQAADKDGSGTLSKDEIRQALIKEAHMMTEEEFKELAEQIRWGEGDINWEDFLSAFKSQFS